jgi:hypothetical protein
LGCGLLVCGGHLAAWATPRSPKIDQHWDLVAPNVFVKRRFVQLRGMRGKQGFVATAAVRRLGLIGGFYAVGGVAMGANDVQGIRHGEILLEI